VGCQQGAQVMLPWRVEASESLCRRWAGRSVSLSIVALGLSHHPQPCVVLGRLRAGREERGRETLAVACEGQRRQLGSPGGVEVIVPCVGYCRSKSHLPRHSESYAPTAPAPQPIKRGWERSTHLSTRSGCFSWGPLRARGQGACQQALACGDAYKGWVSSEGSGWQATLE